MKHHRRLIRLDDVENPLAHLGKIELRIASVILLIGAAVGGLVFWKREPAHKPVEYIPEKVEATPTPANKDPEVIRRTDWEFNELTRRATTTLETDPNLLPRP